MHPKKAGGRVYGASMTAGERKAMHMEIQRQLVEHAERHELELISTILWVLHEEFEFGKVRLRRFHDSFDESLKKLYERYELEEGDQVWLATAELAEYGIDIREWKDELEAKKTVADKHKRNPEGYSDPTAYGALKEMDKEDVRFHKLLNAIFNLVDLAGFEIQGRITLVDKRTGRVWK